MAEALHITLYGVDDEVKAEFSRSFVPWGILKKAAVLAPKLEAETVGEELIDGIAELVVEVFGKQFTVDDLNKGASVGEMMAVVKGLVSQVNFTLGQE